MKINVSLAVVSARFAISIVLDAREKDETLAKIRQARQRIRAEILEFTERLRITQENLHRLRQSSTGGTANERV